jgi:uncharacterized protein YndB with AHSA1/START domain
MATAPGTRTTEFTTPSERELALTRVFDAPRRVVWEAFTSPDHLPHWMVGPGGSSMVVCEVDLRPGGSWRFAWRGSDGTEMEMHGEYRDVAPPERFVSTEVWGGDWPETLNTLLLSEENGRTTSTLTLLYPSHEARDAALHSGMKEGAAASYDRLAGYVGARA